MHINVIDVYATYVKGQEKKLHLYRGLASGCGSPYVIVILSY